MQPQAQEEEQQQQLEEKKKKAIPLPLSPLLPKKVPLL